MPIFSSYFQDCKKHLFIMTCDKYMLTNSTVCSGEISSRTHKTQPSKTIITQQPRPLSIYK